MMDFTGVKSITIPEGNVAKITCGDAVLWEQQTSLLPSAYQQVEYIGTNGDQYIDTKVLPCDYPDGIHYTLDSTITEYTVNADNSTDFLCYLWGCYSNDVRSGYVGYNSYGGNIRMYCGSSLTTMYSWVTILNVPIIWKAFATSNDANNATLSIMKDGEDKASIVNTYTVSNCEMPEESIYLFKCRGYTDRPGQNMKTRAFKMDAADGTSIRNFVPCYRVADGVIGLYDTVGGAFYENAGSGTFTKGEDILV